MKPFYPHAAALVRKTMGNARTLRNGWSPQYVVWVARAMVSTERAARLLLSFGFPLTVALAVLTGHHVDILL